VSVSSDALAPRLSDDGIVEQEASWALWVDLASRHSAVRRRAGEGPSGIDDRAECEALEGCSLDVRNCFRGAAGAFWNVLRLSSTPFAAMLVPAAPRMRSRRRCNLSIHQRDALAFLRAGPARVAIQSKFPSASETTERNHSSLPAND
jgi:hypothetical protein